MARKLRVEYPGAVYHVMNRGNRREGIFREDRDRVLFLETLAEACLKTGWETGDHDDLELDCRTVKDGRSGFLGEPAPKRERTMKICEYAGLTRYDPFKIADQMGKVAKVMCKMTGLTEMEEDLSKSKEAPEVETDEVMKMIDDYRAKEATGAFEYPKHTYKEVCSWRQAWIFAFYIVHLDHTDFLMSEAEIVRCVVLPGREFNDRIINVLKKIADRIGLDNNLKEIRLIETGASSAGIENLAKILPNASIKLFTQEQAKKNRSIKYVNTDIEWIKKLQGESGPL